ncbi:hypothetical protein OAA91_00930 [Fibrobacterales bacterium]|nr:hypothetical protein [Fibrobacterales bacterium]
MEAIITIVGFLGAGKTTLLRSLISSYDKLGWNPYVVLNDYENAYVDVEQLKSKLNPKCIKALSGSCICCSGVLELRDFVNCIPERKNGITLIEANGTSDAVELMGFLGVGIDERFLPPIQISVVDVKNWQTRGEHNELEASQIQVSSLIVLTHFELSTEKRVTEVIAQIASLNKKAKICKLTELEPESLMSLTPSTNLPRSLDHEKAHWASSSCDLPTLPDLSCVKYICDNIPKSILRLKGVTKIGEDDKYVFFERVPNGEMFVKDYSGFPTTGTKLLSIGLGSNPELLKRIVQEALSAVIEVVKPPHSLQHLQN